MKYSNIQALVPQGEHFDESAIVNEGGFLTVSHLNAIEDSLANNAGALSAVQEQLDAANSTITSLTAERDAANVSLATANETLASNNIAIAGLQKQVKDLGAKESGAGSATVTEVDPIVKETPANSTKPKFNSPDHPANKAAAKWVKGSVTK